jgi:hypothetical protein
MISLDTDSTLSVLTLLIECNKPRTKIQQCITLRDKYTGGKPQGNEIKTAFGGPENKNYTWRHIFVLFYTPRAQAYYTTCRPAQMRK